MNDTVACEKDGTEALSDQAEIGRLLVRGGGECFEVAWDAGAKVTPMGSVVFFAQYLKTGGLLDRLCEASPLAYGSNNAPKACDSGFVGCSFTKGCSSPDPHGWPAKRHPIITLYSSQPPSAAP